MADELADLRRAQPGCLESVRDQLSQLGDAELEDLPAVHPQAAYADGIVAIVVGDLLLAAGHIEGPPTAAIGIHAVVQAAHFGIVVARRHDRAGGVAEEDGDAALAEIDHRAHGVTPDDPDRLVVAAADQRVGDVEPVEKPATGRHQIERGRGNGAEGGRDAARVGGARHFRCDGGKDDQIELVCGHPCIFQRPLQGIAAEGEGPLTRLVDDAPLPNARPLDDPLIRGVEHLFEIVVGEHTIGHGRAKPGQPNPECAGWRHATATSIAASCRLMASLTPDATNCLARSTALVMVLATLEP